MRENDSTELLLSGIAKSGTWELKQIYSTGEFDLNMVYNLFPAWVNSISAMLVVVYDLKKRKYKELMLYYTNHKTSEGDKKIFASKSDLNAFLKELALPEYKGLKEGE